MIIWLRVSLAPFGKLPNACTWAVGKASTKNYTWPTKRTKRQNMQTRKSEKLWFDPGLVKSYGLTPLKTSVADYPHSLNRVRFPGITRCEKYRVADWKFFPIYAPVFFDFSYSFPFGSPCEHFFFCPFGFQKDE